MNEELWSQTVEIATGQIVELEGVTVDDTAYRSDLAQAAVDALEAEGLDVNGATYERREIELVEGGE
jgi:hypothetical protein